jgi:glycosyltransferase involved in cell wall biosynthesis
MRQIVAAPLLSIVVPTFQRSDELVLAVSSIADQLTGGLEQKVEIIITDNASGPDTVGKIKYLASQYSTISYLLHKRDEGGFFQFFAAPWRARGRYTWVFGSDDVLLPGGVAHVVELLEREAPSYLTLNKKVYSKDLSQEIWNAANTVPDKRFETFEDLMAAMGINQLAFISGNIELTESCRAWDAEPYLKVDTRHPHVVAFLAKHHGKPSFYSSAPYLVHRINNGLGLNYHLGNFFDYAVTLSTLLDQILKQVGAPADYFERMNGDKRIIEYGPPAITFVDNILENLLRSMGGGRYFTVSQRWALEAILAHCRSGRVQQLNEIWKMQEDIQTLEQRAEESKAMVEQGRQACLQASQTFVKQA